MSSAWEIVTDIEIYSSVNYDPFKEPIQQIYENYLSSMSTWFIIFITVVDNLMAAMGIVTYFYCKNRQTK